MKHVWISILEYNGEEDTVRCLDSLNSLETGDLKVSIVIVDNYPKGTFVLPNKKYKFPITLLKTKQNEGFSGGQNVGIKHALENGADYVMVLNNDTEVDKKLLVALIKRLEEDPKIGAVVPKIYFAKGHEFHKDRYQKDELGKVIWYAGGKMDWNNVFGTNIGVDDVDKGQFDTPGEIDLITGCCVVFTRKALETVGIFDERYFLYYEDADLNERLKRAGFAIFYEPKGVLWHINAGATGGSGSVLQDYFISRNRMLFGMTHAPVRSKVALIRESIRILLNGREWQKKGVRDYYLRKFGRGSYAI